MSSRGILALFALILLGWAAVVLAGVLLGPYAAPPARWCTRDSTGAVTCIVSCDSRDLLDRELCK